MLIPAMLQSKQMSFQSSGAGKDLRHHAALSAPSLHRDLGQNRHCDFFRRDGAEIETGRCLDAIEG
jgi:hypothetical protein